MADDAEGLDATAWRWLRGVYLRLLCPSVVSLEAMTEPERALLLEPHHRDMESDLRVVMTMIERGRFEAIGAWRERIHRTEGTDHEMLDQALDFVMNADAESD